MSDFSPRRMRGSHDIIIDILHSALNGARKTHIMNKANLSFAQFERYSNALRKADFITEESGIWKTTEKGLHVIEACRLCHTLMKELP